MTLIAHLFVVTILRPKAANTFISIQELVEEAKTYHLLADRRGELRSPRTRPRKDAGNTC